MFASSSKLYPWLCTELINCKVVSMSVTTDPCMHHLCVVLYSDKLVPPDREPHQRHYQYLVSVVGGWTTEIMNLV